MKINTFHHGTIRKYTAALLDLFSNVQVQYILTNGEPRHKNVPLVFSTREKSVILDSVTQEQLLSGNFSVLPRGGLTFGSLQRNPERSRNKNLKVNKLRGSDRIEYSYNSIGYDFSYNLSYHCRGMNEATQLIEQITVLFNPNLHMNVFDADNLTCSTSIPISLESVSYDVDELGPESKNIVTVSFDLVVHGYMYQPIKTEGRVKEFHMYMNTVIDDFNAKRSDMLEFDVDNEGYVISPEVIPNPDD